MGICWPRTDIKWLHSSDVSANPTYCIAMGTHKHSWPWYSLYKLHGLLKMYTCTYTHMHAHVHKHTHLLLPCTHTHTGMSTSSRDSPPQFVLVNGHMSGRMSEHDYMSIKSRANSPAPSRILICNVGDQGSVPNNYVFEHPQLIRPPVTGGSQTLDHMFSTRGAVPETRPNGQLPEPIYNTVKSTKRLTLWIFANIRFFVSEFHCLCVSCI